jgi:hypothetical protein
MRALFLALRSLENFENLQRRRKNLTFEVLAKMVHCVILNEVKDLNLMKIRDSSLRSE